MALDLQVASSLSSTPQEITDQNGTQSGVFLTSSPNGQLVLGAPGEWIQNSAEAGSNYGLAFYGASAERMRITNIGQVGINTTNPTATLHVNGNVRIDGLQAPATTDVNILVVDSDGNLFVQPWSSSNKL